MTLALHQRDNPKPITITVQRARELSGLGLTKIYHFINSGELESVLVGKRRLIKLASLEKLLGGEKPVKQRPGRRKTAQAA